MAFPFFRRRRQEPEVIGSDAPDAFYLGRYHDYETGRDGPKLQMPGTEPIIVIGRNRSGKDAGIGNFNVLQLGGRRSKFWFDPRLEAAAIGAPYCRTLGPTYVIDPLCIAATFPPDYADLKSDGWGALARYRASDPRLFDYAASDGEASIPMDKHNPHFTNRARGGFTGAAMIEVIEAEQEGRVPLLSNARMKVTEGVEYDAQGEPIKGWIATARRWQNNGNPQIASLLGNFTENNDEMRGVLATVDGASQYLLSSAMIADENKNRCPLHELGDYPMSVFCGLPHESVQADSMYAPYARLVISTALRSLYRPRPNGVPCTFWINEFTALGRLQAIETSIGLVAGYGIQVVLVVQSLSALRELYSHAWEAFVGNAAALVLVGAPADKFTAEYLSARSGDTTIRQPNAGMQLNSAGVGISSGEGYTRRRYLMPSDLYDLPPGYGFVFMAGMADPIPARFPPYWTEEPTNSRARRNPFYRG
jgi:type IV secretory pathway TraG/TraD family ATPase VirD4